MNSKILILGLLLGLLAAPAAQAATFTVTTTNDTGAGSLREAIADANARCCATCVSEAYGCVTTSTLTPLVRAYSIAPSSLTT